MVSLFYKQHTEHVKEAKDAAENSAPSRVQKKLNELSDRKTEYINLG
jgi:hypothetical protein